MRPLYERLSLLLLALLALPAFTWATLIVTPDPVEFGTVEIGESAFIGLSISNDGDGDMQAIVSINGDDAFLLDGFPTDSVLTVPAGGDDNSLTVEFSPSDVGGAFAVLSLQPLGDQAPVNVLINGTGTAPGGGSNDLAAFPASVNFGTIPMDAAVEAHVYLVNQTDRTLDLTLTVTNDDFQLLSEPQITLPPEDQAGEEGNVLLLYGPLAVGESTGELVVSAADDSVMPLIVPLTGEAVNENDGPRLMIDPLVVDFGPVEVGEAETRPVFLFNTGSEDLMVTAVAEGPSIRLDGPSQLMIPAGVTDSTYQVFVTAEPETANDFAGVISFLSNDPIEPLKQIEVIGYGTIDGQGGGNDLLALLAPADDDTVTSLPMQFRWESYPANDSEIVSYELVLHGHAGDTSVVDLVIPTGTDTSLTEGSDVLVDQIGYTWHVVATVQQGDAVDWVSSDAHFDFFLDWDAIFNTGANEAPLATAVPAIFEIARVYPNPFNPATTVELTVPASGRVNVEVHDILGRRVAVLQNGLLPTGQHTLTWSPTVSAGMYFLTARFENGPVRVEKLMFMK